MRDSACLVPAPSSAQLAGNLLTDASCVAIAAALAGNSTITHLDLARNSINAIGAQALRQALHSNVALTSLGMLESLPVAVGLRASLEWYLRNNAQRLADLSLEAERSASQRDGLLRLLPPEEARLRRQIFRLEDERNVLTTENVAQKTESSQVGKLLHETIKRNAELVDAVATLQGQVDALRKDAAGKKVNNAGKKVKRAVGKAGQQADGKARAAQAANASRAAAHAGLRAMARKEDAALQGDVFSLWAAKGEPQEDEDFGLPDLPVGLEIL